MSDDQKLLDLAERVEKASGLLVGEMTAKLLREARSLVWPRPAGIRVPTMANGEPWPGDGIGPYTEEFKAWSRVTEPFEKMLVAGAFREAAFMLVPEDRASISLFIFADFSEATVLRPRVTELESGGTMHESYSGKGRAATPALALTAACLRAIAKGAEHD